MRFCDVSSGLVVLCQLASAVSAANLPEDATLFFEELSRKYKHPARKYNVITEDGYVLSLHNLPGNKRVPVLLMHGFQGASDSWMLRGNVSLPIVLANAGFDVWLGNNRGNRYSRRHRHLDPDHDPAFWDFSFHELGVYDLSAIIDKVLEQTGTKKITTIGFSLGSTLFYVLGSTKPEYNAKINVHIALAPVCYLNHIPLLLSTMTELTPLIGNILDKLNIYESFDKPMRGIIKQLCTLPVIGYKICIEGVLFPLLGSDPEEVSPEFTKILYPHFPSSGSVKTVLHLAQLHNRKTFARYDYGVLKNKGVYDTSAPPEYELAKVTMPVAIIVGENDKVSVIKDVDILRRALPNVVSYVVSPRSQFNHLDNIWGEHMDVYLYPYIFKILEQYS